MRLVRIDTFRVVATLQSLTTSVFFWRPLDEERFFGLGTCKTTPEDSCGCDHPTRVLESVPIVYVLSLLIPSQLPRWFQTTDSSVRGPLAATNAAALLPVVRGTPHRVSLGLAFLLFLPGYAFVAALFPEASEGSRSGEVTDGSNGSEADSPDFVDGSPLLRSVTLAGIERVALSFGLSVAFVPLIALFLDFMLRRPASRRS